MIPRDDQTIVFSARFITRKAWGAAPYKGQANGHVPKLICIHHTYQPTAAEYMRRDQKARLQMIRSIQRYHQETQGWSDIGYHYIIGPDGLVYEGRDVMLIGSHCGGTPPRGSMRVFGNTGTIGISVIGDYDTEKPTPEALNALNRLVGYLQARFYINAELTGHFQAWAPVAPKTCPGRSMVEILSSVAPSMKAAWNQAFPKNSLP